MSNNDWVFWLNVMNVALGVIVLLAVLLLAYGVVWELAVRQKKRHGVRNLDAEMQAMLRNEFSHSLSVPELGLTMADGGEHVHPAAEKPKEEKKEN